MIQEDIATLSQRLHVSLISLQKMPMDQVRHLSNIISRIPDFFHGVLQDVSYEMLVGKILLDECAP